MIAPDGSYRMPEKMRQSGSLNIAVAGCGGTGSMLLAELVRMLIAMEQLDPGLKITVTVCDPDTVSPANVGRQLFYSSDIGENKAVAAVNRYTASGMVAADRLIAAPVNFDNNYSAYNGDIAVGCVDSKRARDSIRQVTGGPSRGRILIDCGNGPDYGQVLFGAYEKGKWVVPSPYDRCPDLVSGEEDADSGPSCSLAEALTRQSLFINRMVAAEAGLMIWDLIRFDRLTHRAAYINLTGNTIREKMKF